TLVFGTTVTGSGAAHSAIIDGGTLEYQSASNENVTFGSATGLTLKLDNSPQFNGTLAAFRAQETLDLTNITIQNSGQATYNATTGVLTVSDTPPAHTANIVLKGPYQNSIFTTANDGSGHVKVTVEAAPFLNNIAAADVYTALSSTPVVLSAGVTLTDIDNVNLQSATVSISGGFLAGDTLTINGTTSGSITGGANTILYSYSSGTMSLTGSASVADYQAALRLVAFSTNAGGTTRTISWAANDGTVSSVTGNATLSLTSKAYVWGTT